MRAWEVYYTKESKESTTQKAPFLFDWCEQA